MYKREIGLLILDIILLINKFENYIYRIFINLPINIQSWLREIKDGDKNVADK